MRLGIAKGLPSQNVRLLLDDRNFSIESSMHKHVCVRLEIIDTTGFEESPVRFRNPRVAVRCERISATDIQPEIKFVRKLLRPKHELFMISPKWHEPASRIKINHPIDDAAGVGAPIDIVAERDEQIIVRKRYRI